jgi:hypothetical protein
MDPTISPLDYDDHLTSFAKLLKHAHAYNRGLGDLPDDPETLNPFARGIIDCVWEFDHERRNRALTGNKSDEHYDGQIILARKESLSPSGTKQFKICGALTGHRLMDILKEYPALAKDRKNEMILENADTAHCYFVRDLFVHSEVPDAGEMLLKEIAERSQKLGYTRLVTRVPATLEAGLKWYEEHGFKKAFTDRTADTSPKRNNVASHIKYLMNPPTVEYEADTPPMVEEEPEVAKTPLPEAPKKDSTIVRDLKDKGFPEMFLH